jgi:hypothetical protein
VAGKLVDGARPGVDELPDPRQALAVVPLQLARPAGRVAIGLAVGGENELDRKRSHALERIEELRECVRMAGRGLDVRREAGEQQVSADQDPVPLAP